MADETAEIPPANPNKITTTMSKEGMLCAQAALLIMALIPIYLGTKASITSLIKRRAAIARGEKVAADDIEILQTKDAMKFPLTASCALFGLYVVVKTIDPTYLNYLLSTYFMIIGIFAITNSLCEIPSLYKMFPQVFKNDKFHLKFTQNDEEHCNWNFTFVECVYGVFSLAIGAWYIIFKHWIANNVLGLAFSMNAIQLLQLGSFKTGAILLGGLFFYDIFWVFGTEVMVSVAKTIDAPIKILFPTDFLTNGIFGTQHSMLGLGDIVIPGIMIALLARFDVSLGRNKNTYFHTGLASFFVGLVVTMIVMNVFKHAQPALLYLVPSCLLLPLLVAFVNGDHKALIDYEDEEAAEQRTNEATEKEAAAKESTEDKKDN